MKNTKLKQTIQSKELAHKQLSELSIVPVYTINHICTGKHDNPKIDTIRKIADALGVTVNDLIY